MGTPCGCRSFSVPSGLLITAWQRLRILVKGSYAATQCTTIQETLVKFAIVLHNGHPELEEADVHFSA
jgi:hypothetical protein